jgi:tRNA(fMet)-specific endonuclease VapC
MNGNSTTLDVNLATAEVYARLRLDLRKKGAPIPENDLWIAAICVQHRVPLWTDDTHFSSVPDLVLATP